MPIWIRLARNTRSYSFSSSLGIPIVLLVVPEYPRSNLLLSRPRWEADDSKGEIQQPAVDLGTYFSRILLVGSVTWHNVTRGK